MRSEWIDEGLRQVHLAMLWRGYAALLEVASTPVELTKDLRTLSTTFLQPVWLPGADEVVEALVSSPEAVSAPDLCEKAVDAFSAWIRQTVPGQSDGVDPRTALRQWMTDCGSKARVGPPTEGEGTDEQPPFPGSSWPGPPPDARVASWVKQARDLVSWQRGAEQRERARRFATRYGQWTSLREACAHLEGRIGEERQRGWSLPLFGRQRDGDLLKEASMILGRCRSAIDEIIEVAPRSTVESLLVKLEEAVGAVLDASGPSWPPMLLARLQEKVDVPGEKTGFLSHLAEVAERGDRPLAQRVGPLASLGDEVRARLFLAHLVLETVTDYGIGERHGTTVQEALTDLLRSAGLVIKVIVRLDGKLPPSWFELVVDETLGPSLEQLGMAIRTGEDDWICIRPARFRVPSPARLLQRLAAQLAGASESCDRLVLLCLDLVATLNTTANTLSWEGLSEECRENFWRLLTHLSQSDPPETDSGRSAVSTPAKPELEPAGAETPWSRLPSPPAFAGPNGHLEAPPLVTWHAKPTDTSEEATVQARDTFKQWIVSEGRDWFHALAHAAHKGCHPERAALRSWLQTLRNEGWCDCYPLLIGEGDTLGWPAGIPFPEGSGWLYDASPPGTIVDVQRFASSPEGARFSLSQGPKGRDTALDAALCCYRTAETLEPREESLITASRRLLDETRKRLLLGTLPSGPELLLQEALDALAQASSGGSSGGEPSTGSRNMSAGMLNDLNTILTSLRQWGEAFGLVVLPRQWSFMREMRLDQLGPEEKAGAIYVFRLSEPKGCVHRVRVFGIARTGGELVRGCALYVSVGPAPPGFTELGGLLREGGHPAEAALEEHLRTWREAVITGTLDVVAVQLYVDFWGTLGAPLRQQAPERATLIAERLAVVLDKGLGLRTFYPKRYQDHPTGWLELASERGVVSGRVRRVIRPGLQDSKGRLRLPAIVEVE